MQRCRAELQSHREDAVAGLAGRTSNNHALGKHTLKSSPRLPKADFNVAYRSGTQSVSQRGPEEPGGAAGQRERSARPSGPAVCGASLLPCARTATSLLLPARSSKCISLRSSVPELAPSLQPAFLGGRPACPSMEGRAASGGARRASSVDVILFYRTLSINEGNL